MPPSDGFFVLLRRAVVGTVSQAGALCSRSTMPPSVGLRELLGKAMVWAVSQAELSARAQPCRPRLDCVRSRGGRGLGQCLKRCIVLALSHAALEWLVRDPGEGVGWDSISSGALCWRSTMPQSIGLCELLGRVLVGTVSQAERSARAQPCRPRMACARSLGGRWLGQCLKRSLVLALNHASLGWIVLPFNQYPEF